ncbi:uncharacterized protein [Rutidosis leptorrhynchoides]|uniref:uncharacterized protein n=1 Tax=Rutidosis leptorrhynchoides TaxID=125765 RepID=UPI003A98E35A
MRLQHESTSTSSRDSIERFSKWLLDVGNGNIGEPDIEDPFNSSWINIPEEYRIKDDENGIQSLISFIYNPEMLINPTALELQSAAIVFLKNDDADMINNVIVSTIQKSNKTYYSNDEAKPYGNDRGESEVLYPNEYLNTLNFPGVHPHELQLKLGIPVILLRNLNLSGGLCNGTRMIVT